MTDSPTEAASFPLSRPTPFDPPAELARHRVEGGVSRLAYPDGHVGWLVTGHELVRAVLSDPRFSSRAELTHTPIPRPSVTEEPRPAPPGFFVSTDPPEHTRYRHLLTGRFTVRRMRALSPRINEITSTSLDVMEREGPPVDLVQALVAAKRAKPGDDLLSGLTGGDLTQEELTNIGFMLLGAGPPLHGAQCPGGRGGGRAAHQGRRVGGHEVVHEAAMLCPAGVIHVSGQR
ncbi:hypothetical protein ACFSKW_00230 [Nonomuraea mangrovi]|uniref:Cytochrome P450 n=1 Tax=Nonomuraea mangrovi TaxID=2316207 RepID=A0ABW4SN02_9ACTN